MICPMRVGDERPARAVACGRHASRAVARPSRVDERPLHERHDGPDQMKPAPRASAPRCPDDENKFSRSHSIGPGMIDARRFGERGMRHHRSVSAMRALYQFMTALVSRLMVR